MTYIGHEFMAGNNHCRFKVRGEDGAEKERVKQLLINAGIPADRIKE